MQEMAIEKRDLRGDEGDRNLACDSTKCNSTQYANVRKAAQHGPLKPLVAVHQIPGDRRTAQRRKNKQESHPCGERLREADLQRRTEIKREMGKKTREKWMNDESMIEWLQFAWMFKHEEANATINENKYEDRVHKNDDKRE